jgi:hypothetical protein
MKDEQDDSKDNHQQQRGKEWEFSHKGLLRGATKKMGKVVLHPTYLYRRSPQDETNREHVKCPHCARFMNGFPAIIKRRSHYPVFRYRALNVCETENGTII